MSTQLAVVIGGSIGLAVGVVGNLIAGHFQNTYSLWVSRSRSRYVLTIVLCVAMVGVASLFFAPDGDTAASSEASSTNVGTNVQSCQQGATCEQVNNPPPTTEAPTTTQAPVLAAALCRDPDPTDPVLPEVEVCVIAWCRGALLNPDGTERTDQGQIKLRPRIINSGATALNIGIGNPSAIRLLLATDDVPGRWSPPPKTAAQGDVPVLVDWEGRKYWAVPPNVPGDARPITFELDGVTYSTYDGFATYWNAPSLLDPGGILYRPIQRDADSHGIRETDLVFNVPTESDGSIAVYGLAVIDTGTNQVLGVQERNLWPPQVKPDSF